MKILNRKAYRCVKCGWRGVLQDNAKKDRYLGNYSLPQLAVIIISLIVAFVLVIWLMRETEKPPPVPVAMKSMGVTGFDANPDSTPKA